MVDDSYAELPGVKPNYLLKPDANQMDADSANLYQGRGGWSAGAIVPDVGAFAATANYYVHAGSNTFYWQCIFNIGFPVVPGQRYSFAAWFRTDNPGNVDEARAYLDWRDSGGGALGGAYPAYEPVDSTAYRALRVDGIAPAGAAYVRPVVAVVPVAAADTGLFLGAAMLADGAYAEWQPSANITGDLHWLVDFAPTLAVPAATSVLFDHAANNQGFDASLLNNGTVWATYGDGTSLRGNGTPILGIADGERCTLEAQWLHDAGELTWLLNGVQLGPVDTFTAGPGVISSHDTWIGSSFGGNAPFAGRMYRYELHDGVDGPVVESFYAEDLAA